MMFLFFCGGGGGGGGKDGYCRFFQKKITRVQKVGRAEARGERRGLIDVWLLQWDAGSVAAAPPPILRHGGD